MEFNTNFTQFLIKQNQIYTEQTKLQFKQEAKAASIIQAALRANRERQNLNIIRTSANIIQASYKRKIQVLKTQKIYDAIQFQGRQKFYSQMAARIQSVWRGHVTRTHVLNIQERRKQLTQIAVASAEQVEYCRQYNDHCENMIVQAKLEDQAQVVKQLSKLHHMRSTKATPGVYKPNYPVLAPTIGGKAVDDILKEEGRRQARTTFKNTRTTPKILDNIKKCVGDI
ncbi:Conserved_hypothetical protein [Hexamita inflata]|uniref:Uncharacterized protein n=2 Tax=Hexamita inflata TaxID=28002 RepID=A0ABP1HBZ9_9EUKA